MIDQQMEKPEKPVNFSNADWKNHSAKKCKENVTMFRLLIKLNAMKYVIQKKKTFTRNLTRSSLSVSK